VRATNDSYACLSSDILCPVPAKASNEEVRKVKPDDIDHRSQKLRKSIVVEDVHSDTSTSD